MADWKLLGEVPDSEEEDGYESPSASRLPAPNEPEHTSQKASTKDIWEFTELEPVGALNRKASPPATQFESIESSPLSSAQSLDDLPGLDQMLQDTPNGLGSQNSNPQKVPKDEVSRSYVRITAPTPTEYSMTDDAARLHDEAAPASRLPPIASQDLGHLPDMEAIQNAAIRLERSLRPRKPIQEHPYLLENAHYSSLFRKHGVRPVQMAAAMEKRRIEAANNDGDFEEDSQESMLPRLLDSSLRESGSDSDDIREIGVFDIPSSSPLKTSPWAARAVQSSRPSSPGETDNTSILDHDLPTVQDLISRTERPALKVARRRETTPGSVAQKRRGRNIIDSDPPEPAQRDPSPAQQRAGGSSAQQVRRQLEPGPLPAIPQLQYVAQPRDVPRPAEQRDSSAEVISSDEGRDSPDRPGNSSGREDQEGVYMNSIGRRIKGVLPASWLRLDQKTSRDKAQKNIQKRHRSRIQERESRRGVAQLRQPAAASTAARATSAVPWFYDESEDDETPEPRAADEFFHNQTRLMMLPQEIEERPATLISDDDGSAMEDNSVDPMLFSLKRQRKAPLTTPARKRQRVPNQGRNKNDTRQPKITSHLPSPRRTTGMKSGSTSRHSGKRSSKASSKRSGRTGAGQPPPQLSVLDVIEPNAPSFLRIAARAARRRGDQGRSSPSKKSIRLATRVDHIDAASTLNNWKSGTIKQRHSVTAKTSKRESHTQRSRKPLSERNGNTMSRDSNGERRKLALNAPRKFVKRVSNGGHVQYGLKKASSTRARSGAGLEGNTEDLPTAGHSESFRPAQLEVGESDKALAISFHRRKRCLDKLYLRRHRDTSVASFDAASVGSGSTHPPRHEIDTAVQTSAATIPPAAKRRPRKGNRPVRVDTEAPPFQHAADPLPVQYVLEDEPVAQLNTANKLRGLGPYGTVYTTHFEVFPLNSGVYFHESTLVGSGALDSLTCTMDLQRLLDSRPSAIFQLGNRTLRWGVWNDQTSSELGVLFDTIAEEIESFNGSSPDGRNAMNSAGFLVTYIRDSLSFADQDGAKSFVARLLDVVKGFTCRTTSRVLSWTALEKEAANKLLLGIYDSVVFIVYSTIRLCRTHDCLMNEQFQAEGSLRDVAKVSISTLLDIGTEQILRTYEKMQIASARERGLRNDEPVAHSWVLVMQILDLAHIPRGGFWETLKAVLAPTDKVTTTDAQTHEEIWASLFAVLPLSEFTPSGVLMPGKRHQVTADGWTIPQQLLKQVFFLYREDEHQAASFNNYCRALISRCHYLVQQWGWHRSGTVVGVIFDFFGSQNLAHLRNEEVRGSPKFLEELADMPSLALEPEDKCFHIFLKLLALSIRKLRAAGNVKDVRNLVARTIPNHNRQHLKEQTVYERDLAALRNHHDLLGTLFWAAPPDMRPAVALIQRLVAPSTSHKEACLINIRSWNQLARFIAASGEITTSFRGFVHWRNSFFQETLQQFDSVASDIHQQLHSLPKEITETVNNEMIESMISLNKKAVTDILGASVRASLDVMRRAPDLEAASFCLNNIQLQHIFKHFSVSPPEFEWSTLRAALSTLESFISKIDEFKDNEESQQSESQLLNSAQADDALIVVDNDLSRGYFSMLRNILSSECSLSAGLLSDGDRAWCVEAGVELAARMGASFANGGLIRLPDMFKSGKYGLFDGAIHRLSLERRKHLVLFVASLLKAKVDDFGELDFNLCELWILSLVKPLGYLDNQNQLLEQLRLRGEFYVPNAGTILPLVPDYSTNRDLFDIAISAMRRSVRDSGPSLRRTLVGEYAKSLKLVMEQLKDDLKTVLPDATKHYAYVAFTQHIISLIRTHGSEICVVDDYFYQISPEYSPSAQDPNLQVAAMVSYGLRISEGDEKVAQQLFFFLFNNFKMAMVSDSLKEEATKLAKGMENAEILQFVVAKMLPATICASVRNRVTFPLLDVYILATRRVLRRRNSLNRLSERDIPTLAAVFTAILYPLCGLLADEPAPDVCRIHILRQAIALANILWPSIYNLSLNGMSSPEWVELAKSLKLINELLLVIESNVKDIAASGDYAIAPLQLLTGLPCDEMAAPALSDNQISGFTDNIVQDANRNWVETADRITARTPAKPREEAPQGVRIPKWDTETILRGLNKQMLEWRHWWARFNGAYCQETQPPVIF